jgi:hypothetical protein
MAHRCFNSPAQSFPSLRGALFVYPPTAHSAPQGPSGYRLGKRSSRK